MVTALRDGGLKRHAIAGLTATTGSNKWFATGPQAGGDAAPKTEGTTTTAPMPHAPGLPAGPMSGPVPNMRDARQNNSRTHAAMDDAD